VIAQGLSGFAPEAAMFQAGRVMLERLDELAGERADFAFETTLASRTFGPWLRRLQMDFGYRVYLLYLWLPDSAQAVDRVRRRVSLGGHSVPEDVIRRRYVRGIQNFFRLYEPLADAWAFCDNSEVPNATIIACRDPQAGTRVIRADLWNLARSCINV
jgi:predicted ABC-type ATPase